jgi:hypothetical protein
MAPRHASDLPRAKIDYAVDVLARLDRRRAGAELGAEMHDMGARVPLVTMMAPVASTVLGWHVAHVVVVIDGSCAASIGGTPWQLPQATWPDDVHRGSAEPWQYVFVHTCVSWS